MQDEIFNPGGRVFYNEVRLRNVNRFISQCISQEKQCFWTSVAVCDHPVFVGACCLSAKEAGGRFLSCNETRFEPDSLVNVWCYIVVRNVVACLLACLLACLRAFVANHHPAHQQHLAVNDATAGHHECDGASLFGCHLRVVYGGRSLRPGAKMPTHAHPPRPHAAMFV